VASGAATSTHPSNANGAVESSVPIGAGVPAVRAGVVPLASMSPSTSATPPSPRLERSTIEHVASAAGVSVATVSRALRGLPNVAVETRARVEEVARQLHYRADPAASRLAAGRSRTIAVVVPMLNSWYFASVVAGAEAVCAEDGYDLLVLTAPSLAARHKVVATAAALDRRVDGLIFVEVALTDDDVAGLDQRRLGVVTIGQEIDGFPSVRIDNVAIGRTAVEHLVTLGHRSIGVLGAQAEEPMYFDVPGQRIHGAEQALVAAGLMLDRGLVGSGEFTVEGGHRAAEALLSRADRPTALFALSDEMAFGAFIAARRLGLDVPDDVSLIGVDDHEVAVVLGLTTVRQRVVEHGALAARALLRRLAGDGTDVEHTVGQPELVVRDSTRPPRSLT
jgi:LacI family transcriptional regulator, repressor for deo operon, udp, cdd, tsx, nupC, and nupG